MIRRGFDHDFTIEALTLADDGIIAEYFAPTAALEPGPAVLVIGGSNGGLPGRLKLPRCSPDTTSTS